MGTHSRLSWNPNPFVPFALLPSSLDSLRALRCEEIPRCFSTLLTTLSGRERDQTIGGESRLPAPAPQVVSPSPSPPLLRNFLLDPFLVLLRRLRRVGGGDQDHNIFV